MTTATDFPDWPHVLIAVGSSLYRQIAPGGLVTYNAVIAGVDGDGGTICIDPNTRPIDITASADDGWSGDLEDAIRDCISPLLEQWQAVVRVWWVPGEVELHARVRAALNWIRRMECHGGQPYSATPIRWRQGGFPELQLYGDGGSVSFVGQRDLFGDVTLAAVASGTAALNLARRIAERGQLYGLPVHVVAPE